MEGTLLIKENRASEENASEEVGIISPQKVGTQKLNTPQSVKPASTYPNTQHRPKPFKRTGNTTPRLRSRRLGTSYHHTGSCPAALVRVPQRNGNDETRCILAAPRIRKLGTVVPSLAAAAGPPAASAVVALPQAAIELQPLQSVAAPAPQTST